MTDQDLTDRTLAQFAPYMMNRIMHRYNQSLQALIAPMGLSVSKMRALAALAAQGDLTVNALSVYAVSEQSTMSRTVDQMERDGLIQRQVSPDDHRVRVVSLTDAGMQAYKTVWPKMRAAEEAMFDGMPEGERAEFLSTLNAVLRNIRVHDF